MRVQLFGTFDAQSVDAWRVSLEILAVSAAKRVVLDFSSVTLLDGTGVGAIAYLFKRLLARDRKLVVTSVSGQPLAMLRDLGLAKALGLGAAPVRAMSLRQRWFGGLAVAGTN